jgi:hypothetical protein
VLVKWQGRELGEFRGMPRIKEARKIRSMTGLLPEQWLNGLEQGDPDCFVSLVVIMLSRNGEEVRFDSIDGEYDDLDISFSEEEKKKQAEAAAEQSINPTISRILDRLDIQVANDKVHAIVMEDLLRGEEEGKEGQSPTNEASHSGIVT